MNSQNEHLQKIYGASIEKFPEMAILKGLLLGIGGRDVVFFHPDPMTGLLIEHGKHHSPEKAVVQPGEPHNCHKNALEIARRSAIFQWGSGYALSDDGLWRQHSWAISDDGNKIIETTELRTAYFGIALPYEIAKPMCA